MKLGVISESDLEDLSYSSLDEDEMKMKKRPKIPARSNVAVLLLEKREIEYEANRFYLKQTKSASPFKFRVIRQTRLHTRFVSSSFRLYQTK